MISDPDSVRFQLLVERAERAGYRLMRDPWTPCTWILLDTEDGEPLHSAATLDLIEQWLAL
ncbi:hypothetical protein ACIHDR_15975 [Nocardia sp. NPDC052278]|uniref:hypothetical protein n=1 Tax=unclassified Nocardia TaxID=2637762 RepID=UPI0036B0B833